ncbi:MAG: outer membrane lipoprotein-sorting protein [Kiritimatiellia bacterium]|nr:outer membrane lipoprotein-sorting protein [Kiritimatiellia bacterium]
MKNTPGCVCLLCVVTLGAVCRVDAEPRPATAEAAREENLTAAQILAACTQLIPTDRMLLQGTLTVRKLRGIKLAEEPFKLMLDWGARPPSAEVLLLDASGTSLVERAVLTRPAGRPAQISLFRGPEQRPVDAPSYAGRVRGTDMTWMDLTLDFLWWTEVRFDDVPRGESRNGRDCDILVTVPPAPIPGCSAVRVWVDRQLRCLMQAEQLDPQGTPVRKMWVQRVKKTDDRWMIRDMEIETLNSGHRTRLSVADVSSP